MKQYFTGVFTATIFFSSTLLFIGSQNKNLQDIEANSLLIKSENGNIILQGGIISLYNSKGNEVCAIGTSPDGEGLITSSNIDGKITFSIGHSEFGGGELKAFNNEKMTNYIGEGSIQTFSDQSYQTSYIGVSENSDGMLFLKNKSNNKTVWLGSINTEKYEGHGCINLYDKNGSYGWGMAGKE